MMQPQQGIAPIRVFVLLRHGLNRDSWSSRFRAGEAWDETPYGYGLASERFRLDWSKDRTEGKYGSFLRRAIQRVFGADLLHVLHNLKRIKASDIVWTHTEREYLALLLLTRGRGPFVIAQTVWLWDRWSGFPPLKKRLYRRLLSFADVEIVHSRLNLQVARREAPDRPVVLVPFGTTSVSDDLQRPAVIEKRVRPLLIAAGNDPDRDWRVLAEAARLLRECDLNLYTSSRSALDLDWPSNVAVRQDATVHDIRSAYLAADVVVLPLRPNFHASGATVAGESMSAGKPLVVPEVGGIADYAKGVGCFGYTTGDSESLALAVRAALSATVDPAQIIAKRASRGLTPVDYVRRYELLSLALVHGLEIPPEVSAFSSVPPP